jgi:RNA polymerase sigma-19 factor, ECF subfamily
VTGHNSAEDSPDAAAELPGSEPSLEACRARLHHFLARRLRREQDVHDLVQDVYVRFLQTPHRAAVREPIAYLFRIAANLLHDTHMRAQRPWVTYSSELADAQAEHPGDVWKDEVGDRISAAQEVEQALQQLPAIYQSVLLLRKRDGLSCADIAKTLGISKFTAEKYLYRAIAHFKEVDRHRQGRHREIA